MEDICTVTVVGTINLLHSGGSFTSNTFDLPLQYTPCSGPSNAPYTSLFPNLVGCSMSKDLTLARKVPLEIISSVISWEPVIVKGPSIVKLPVISALPVNIPSHSKSGKPIYVFALTLSTCNLLVILASEALIVVREFEVPLTSKPLSVICKVPFVALVVGSTNSIVESNVLTWPTEAVRK